jgi:hypothetical protein
MMLKRKAPTAKPGGFRSWLRVSGALLVSAVVATTLAAGCLNRPVAKQDPHTSNLFVAEIRQTAVDKIDLLFMIDNSISMADKQLILAQAVPNLMLRLVTPRCVDDNGNPTGTNAGADGRCAGNASPEFTPIKDIHIGVVSSSLGAHGGGGVCLKETDNDQGQLVAKFRNDPANPVVTWNSSGFLAWDPDRARPRNTPPGETDATNLNKNFTNMVLAVGQGGCGFEASLESWYRFLIDPEPIRSIPTVTDTAGNTAPVFDSDAATNPVLLQRAQFLRPDSLLAIVMLSDENDCSIVDFGQGWLVGTTSITTPQGSQTFHMPRSTSTCATNPNDKCCSSCSASPAAGCPATAGDASCQMTGGSYTVADDNTNLRCYDQKRRFGFDLLYPTKRYVDGLWETTVAKRDGTMAANPIYVAANGAAPRDKSLVFIAGIVGVPWQDIADEATIPDNVGLQYLTYQGLADKGRWDMILGANDGVNPPAAPGDKLMFETPLDRNTIWPGADHPVIHAAGALQPPTAAATANKINGHESSIADNSDLQYACIFPLPTPVDCGGMAAACDCKASDSVYNRALCNGTMQTAAKAYPGVRELQVLKDYGAKGTQNSIVASICPKSLKQGDPSYGYGPAVSAIVDRLKEALRGKCLPRKLVAENNMDLPDFGQVPCAVVEAKPANGEACNCNDMTAKPGRADADDELKVAVYSQLHNAGYCTGPDLPACESYCLCKINQFSGDDLRRCQSEPTAPADIFGYCYVDPDTTTDPDAKTRMETIVASCPASQKRLLRFTGENVPAKGSIAMIACLGATVAQ